MRFDKRCKIERMTTTEVVRYALKFVHVNAAKGRLEASNGKALAVVPVHAEEGETIPDTLLDPEAVAFARKAQKYVEPSLTILPDGAIRNALGEQRPGISKSDQEARYPDMDVVAPDPGDRPPDLIIDPYLLLRMAEAMGVDQPGKDDNRIPRTGVALWFAKGKDGHMIAPEKGIYARPLTGTGAWGVIMPFTHDSGSRVRPHHERREEKVQ